MKISRKHALKAVLTGSCFAPIVGQSCASISTANLIWAETHEIAAPGEIAESGGLPLWVRSGGGGYGGGGYDGYGYDGYGYDGYGYDGGDDGYDDGYGGGYGGGYGYGYGYGGDDGYGGGDGDGGGYGYGGGGGYEEAFKKLKLI